MVNPTENEQPTADDRAASATEGAAGDLDQLQRERGELIDQLQRSRAEFANFQKRVRAQAESDRLYAMGPLAIDLLAVLDNFERAIDAARTADAANLVDGLEMIQKQMLSALAKHGVEPIEALGQPFDPNFHEALIQQPDADHPEGTVVMELGKGYRIRDRVLRPSKVAVSTAPQN